MIPMAWSHIRNVAIVSYTSTKYTQTHVGNHVGLHVTVSGLQGISGTRRIYSFLGVKLKMCGFGLRTQELLTVASGRWGMEAGL